MEKHKDLKPKRVFGIGLLEHLILLNLVFITVISCVNQDKEGFIEIESKEKKVILLKQDFKITENEDYIEIKLTSDKIDSIKGCANCTIFLNKKGTVAKGVYFQSSIAPKTYDYFFPEDNDNQIIISRDSIIRLLPKKVYGW